MENKELYDNFIHQIDTLDSEIIYLLHRRFEIIKQIKELQKGNSNFSNDYLDFDKVINELTPIAEDLCVDISVIKNIWEEINNTAKSI